MRKAVFTNVEGRKIFVGFITDGRVFEKEITERSIFRNSQSWGTEKEVVKKLKEEGIKKIRLYKKDSDEIFEISLSDFLAHAFILDFPGKPEQLLCQLKHFDLIEKDDAPLYSATL